MRYYLYKMTADNGGAPCVTAKLLTLAICKPKIRSACKEGDWLFGFGGRPSLGERLIYIAQITDKSEKGKYYRDLEHRNRGDAIYRWHDGKLIWKKGSKYHEGGHEKDIGKWPSYARAKVLISNNFRYFGKTGTAEYKEEYPALANAIEKLTQGHRVNHSEDIRRDLIELQQQMWREFPSKKKLGTPCDADCSQSCSDTEGKTMVC